MANTVTVNGNTYSDGDNDGGAGELFLGNGGHRVNFIDLISDTIVEVNNVAADLVLTNADVVSTNADVVSTNADVVLTNADVVSTNADVVSTALIYDNFDDRWLGDKAADPTLDNDGDALLEGAAYYNTGVKKIKLYNGTSWDVIQDGLVVPSYTGNAGKQLLVNSGETGVEWGQDYVGTLNEQTFTGNGTWTRPAGVNAVKIFLVAGGGGGGGNKGTAVRSTSGGGGGGEVIEGYYSVSSNITVTIGSGGAGSGVSQGAGGNGGDSTLAGGLVLTAKGGGPGTGSSTVVSPTGNSGNGGGIGGDHASEVCVGGGGGGASGHAGALAGAALTVQSSIRLQNCGTHYKGGCSGRTSSGSNLFSNGGEGVKGHGGGGNGGGFSVGSSDGGGVGSSGSNGGNATANSGGGGGGCSDTSTTQRTGGNGAAGKLIIQWWT